jgi:hypothetical protein
MSEERLMSALGASAAPKRDAAFVVAVLERAEKERYRAESLKALLKGAGLAAAGAALLVLLGGWVGSHAEAAQTVVMTAGALIGLVATTRLMARLSPARR